jgi:hypothetical protein
MMWDIRMKRRFGKYLEKLPGCRHWNTGIDAIKMQWFDNVPFNHE